MSFKIGDRVMVNKDNANSARVDAGDPGTVTMVNAWGNAGDYRVRMDINRGSGDGSWYFKGFHITRALKVGDPVRIPERDGVVTMVCADDGKFGVLHGDSPGLPNTYALDAFPVEVLTPAEPEYANGSTYVDANGARFLRTPDSEWYDYSDGAIEDDDYPTRPLTLEVSA